MSTTAKGGSSDFFSYNVFLYNPFPFSKWTKTWFKYHNSLFSFIIAHILFREIPKWRRELTQWKISFPTMTSKFVLRSSCTKFSFEKNWFRETKLLFLETVKFWTTCRDINMKCSAVQYYNLSRINLKKHSNDFGVHNLNGTLYNDIWIIFLIFIFCIY